MGIFDKFRNRAEDKGRDMSDDAERKVNERTGDKYEDQVDDAQHRIEGQLGMDRDQSDRSDPTGES